MALVAVTTLAIGFLLQALVPDLPLIATIALGAMVAPPDPVAATAVSRQGDAVPRAAAPSTWPLVQPPCALTCSTLDLCTADASCLRH